MNLGIRAKLGTALVAGLVAISVATAGMMDFVQDRAIGLAAEREIAAAAATLDELEGAELAKLSALLEVIAADPALADALTRRDRAAAIARGAPIFEALRARHAVTHFYLHPPAPAEEGVFLRLHRPELHGDPVTRALVAEAVSTGEEARGREVGRTSFALRAVRPWRVGGRLVGYLELGVDLPTFLGRLKRVTGDDYAMLLVKEGLDRAAWEAVEPHERWDARPGLLLVEATLEDGALAAPFQRAADVPAAPALLGQEERGLERAVARGAFPLRAGGQVGGLLAVQHEVSALHAGARDVRVRVLLFVVLLAGGLAALVFFILETLVFERLARMTRELEDLPARLARGDHVGEGELVPRRDDEVGRFERFFDRTIREVGSFVSDVRRERGVRRTGPDDPH